MLDMLNAMQENLNAMLPFLTIIFRQVLTILTTMLQRLLQANFLQTLTLKVEDPSVAEDWQLQVWGTPWTPDEFVDRAVVAGHPAKLHSFLPPLLRDCIEKSLMKSCSQRMAHRAQALKHWLRRSIQLKHQEEELVQTLEPGVAEVLQGKRILVWKEMLQSINYSDMGVVDEFCAGSRLTGQTDLTNLWPSKVTPATMTEGELHAQARLQRDGISFSQVVFFDSEIAHSVWDQTLQEVLRGEAEGPFDLSEVPSHFPLSRRFGVKQNGKIRCVDDFSWSGINAASQARESPKPHTLDVVAAMISTVMCHAEGNHAWVSRSFDLRSAYRQCAVHPESRQFSYIVVGDPNTSSLKAFRLKALPFGSVKSVHSFLRIAHSLWAILTSVFWVVTTNYFDDFVSIADLREAASVDYTVKAVSDCWVGGLLKMDQRRRLSAAVLWLLECSLMCQSYIKDWSASPTPRADGMSWPRHWNQAVTSRSLAKLEALRLRGRMQFASGQFYGRLARRCLAVVTQHAYGSESSTLAEAAIHALSRFRDMLVNGVPRMISSKATTTWFIFTDASHEPHESEPFSGVGGVLVDQFGCRRRFFSERLSPDLLCDINVSQRKTIIYECEFFSVLCAMIAWKDFLHQCNVVIHTDNDAVRDAFIACHTSSTNSLPILDAILKAENDAECNSWITRVPTESNIADDPSRLQVDHLMNCGCLRDHIGCADIWSNTVCKPGNVAKGGGDRPALHTPLEKRRSHCKRGSSQQNLSKQDNGKRTKFWCEVMNCRESTELWLTGLNVKHVNVKQWFLSMTMVATSTCHMSLFFVKIFHAHPQPPWYLVRWLGCAKPKAWRQTSLAHPFGKKKVSLQARVVTAEFKYWVYLGTLRCSWIHSSNRHGALVQKLEDFGTQRHFLCPKHSFSEVGGWAAVYFPHFKASDGG